MVNEKKNSVKINAGEWRSRVLKFPDVDGLRPTPDRVRQTVFNWLGQDLTGQHCLDLFAGTGVMGFEALSRNATSAVLVELAKPALVALADNKAMLQAANAHIVPQDAVKYLTRDAAQLFDVVFCDPPYNKGWLAKILPLLVPHLSAGALVYVEAEFPLDSDVNDMPNFAKQWEIVKQKKAGSVYYHLLRFAQAT
jgi:16S rRNA (guanine966-N2)-methyltransferase